jgi:GT2 family glycosyltransferase
LAEAPQISVIIVTYHTGEAVFDAISSIIEQNAFEIIIVDNGNDDDTRCRLKQMSIDIPNMTYILNKENIGFGAACNKGAKAARGEILLFLNPDASLEQNALVEMAKIKPNQIMGGLIKNNDGSEQRGARRNELTLKTAILAFSGVQDDFNLDKAPLPDGITSVANISGAFFAMYKVDFKRLKGFDEGYFLHVEDIDICTRHRKSGGEVVFNPNAQAFHIGGTSKAAKINIEFYKFMGFARFFLKNGDWVGKFDFLLIAPFLFVAMMFRAIISQKRH